MMAIFKYAMGERVINTVSGEAGTITARIEYANAENEYRVEHTTEEKSVENWWPESQISNEAPAEGGANGTQS